MTQDGAGARIVIGDDNPVHRLRLRRIVSAGQGLEVVGEAADGPGAVEAIVLLDPDAAVLELRMPGAHGPRILTLLRRAQARAGILFASAHPESELGRRIVAAGAGGLVSKDAHPDEICKMIAMVARGEMVATRFGGRIVHGDVRARSVRVRPALSPLERELLALSSAGHSLAQIAHRVGIGVPLASRELSGVCRKLGVTEHTAAAAEAMARGLLE